MADGNTPLTWSVGRQLPMVMQSEGAECALACLAMIACYHGHETDLASLRRRFSTSLKGINLTRLIEIAQALGFEARPLRAELEYLQGAQLPCILHWDLNHFVVLRRFTRRGAEIHDPAKGRYSMPLAEVSKHFTGIVIELAPSADFSPVRKRQELPLRALTGKITGLPTTLLQILGLALAIEVLALVMPFQMQWVVDQVLVSADRPLLLVMTAGFLIVMVAQTGLTIARAWLVSWLGASLNAQWVINLFGHLMKLPLDYFEKRHVGDILSRFSSVQTIQTTLTGSFMEAVLDGLMGMLALVILCLYSLPLTACVVAAFALYALLRVGMYRALWRINEEQLVYGARQQSELIETIRGVQAIKLANRQSVRKVRVANSVLESTQRIMRSQRITSVFGALNQGIFGTQRIALIALGAYLSLRGEFSAGMLLAFVTYADQFSIKVGSLVDKCVDFRMLRLHAERIADIALAAPESFTQGDYAGHEVAPRISVRDLGFRYAEGDPWIFGGLNLSIEAGESVAIVGPSGCGKSTLAKLLLGLLEPTSGSIQIGGVDIRKYGLENYRNLVGTVMQDDTLFPGTIADNISFFDQTAKLSDIVEAAKLANVHADIVDMPMAYESLVGDMGSALSGGQRQRIILARALYRRPRILVLDEATSHLDIENEAAINQSIAAMNMTRIIIAHRPETIASTARVISIPCPCRDRSPTYQA